MTADDYLYVPYGAESLHVYTDKLTVVSLRCIFRHYPDGFISQVANDAFISDRVESEVAVRMRRNRANLRPGISDGRLTITEEAALIPDVDDGLIPVTIMEEIRGQIQDPNIRYMRPQVSPYAEMPDVVDLQQRRLQKQATS